jgi:Skp family chaperone for outer membrane proteins
MQQLQQIVAELGEKGAYTVILEGNNTVVLYGKQDIDLTDQVIEEHNKRFPRGRKRASS